MHTTQHYPHKMSFVVVVKDMEIDLYKFYEETFVFHFVDFQIVAEYVNHYSYNVVVRRLNKYEEEEDNGWNENIQVLSVFKEDQSMIIFVGNSQESEKTILVNTDFFIEPSLKKTEWLPKYIFKKHCPSLIPIQRNEFNVLFDTNITTLSDTLYAVGLKNGIPYIYNEVYKNYYCIICTIEHILKVALMNHHDNFYFIICSRDGYMINNHFSTIRTIPKMMNVNECLHVKDIQIKETEYAVFHEKKYILAQSHHLHMPFALDIVDRHYFYHNSYNSFRSFHCGIPFSLKQPKIVFGGQNRGSSYNFTHRKDIMSTPREFFHGLSKEKNIVSGGWIDRKDMIHYKYILDIDGNSSTWDATAWKLNSGSVIFKSCSGWRQWFYDEYIPNVHFIEIKDDFSDIQEKYKWCEEHEPECLEMIRRCKELFQKVYKFQNVLEHTKKIIETIL